MLEEVRTIKPYFHPSFEMKKEFEHKKFKVYKPFIMQN